jgi:NAD(P)-dependent dehydrogenase (short-subunit alcohol dehydrogenase family)
MVVASIAKFERFFRAAAELDIDKEDLRRYRAFISRKIEDLAIRGQANAKANGRVIVEKFDLPITKGLQESVHAFRKLDETIGLKIVNVAARHALEPRAGGGMTAYTVSKVAVAALTEALAQEVVGQGILVNAVAPSIMDTPQNRQAMPKANYDTWPKVEEVAATILFLASPENRITRGAVVSTFGRS